MTADDAAKELQKFLEYYERGWLTSGEASLRLYELAAFMEPEQLLAAIPELLRRVLRECATGPLIPREEWFTIFGGMYVDSEAFRRRKREQEDRQYAGLTRLHHYFSRQG